MKLKKKGYFIIFLIFILFGTNFVEGAFYDPIIDFVGGILGLESEEPPIGYEYVEENTFLHTWNQNPYPERADIWFNASGGYLQFFNGLNFTDAKEKSKWLTHNFGLAYYNPNGAFKYVSKDMLNTSYYHTIYSDNETRWTEYLWKCLNQTTENNKREFCAGFKRGQQVNDTYMKNNFWFSVNETQAPFTFNKSLWYVWELKNINISLNNRIDSVDYCFLNHLVNESDPIDQNYTWKDCLTFDLDNSNTFEINDFVDLQIRDRETELGHIIIPTINQSANSTKFRLRYEGNGEVLLMGKINDGEPMINWSGTDSVKAQWIDAVGKACKSGLIGYNKVRVCVDSKNNMSGYLYHNKTVTYVYTDTDGKEGFWNIRNNATSWQAYFGFNLNESNSNMTKYSDNHTTVLAIRLGNSAYWAFPPGDWKTGLYSSGGGTISDNSGLDTGDWVLSTGTTMTYPIDWSGFCGGANNPCDVNFPFYELGGDFNDSFYQDFNASLKNQSWFHIVFRDLSLNRQAGKQYWTIWDVLSYEGATMLRFHLNISFDAFDGHMDVDFNAPTNNTEYTMEGDQMQVNLTVDFTNQYPVEWCDFNLNGTTFKVAVNLTNSSVTQNFTVEEIADNYSWSVNCTDLYNWTNRTAGEWIFNVAGVNPTNPTPIINSTWGKNQTGENLICNDTLDDPNGNNLNGTVIWYQNNVSFLSVSFGSYPSGFEWNNTLGSGNTTKYDNWTCEIKLENSEGFLSDWVNSSTLVILNTPPGIANLSSPTDNSTLLNFSPNLVWVAPADNDSDTLYYNLLIDDDIAFGSPEINVTNLADTNYTDQITLTNKTYNWKVIANDGESNSTWSNIWNFTIKRYMQIKQKTPLNDTTFTMEGEQMQINFTWEVNSTRKLSYCNLSLNGTIYNFSLGWTYQESANATLCDDGWDDVQICDYVYDGNWDTYGVAESGAGSSAYIYLNYTKLKNATSDSLFEMKDGQHRLNYSIPTDCWNQNPIQIVGRSVKIANPYAQWFCWDGDSWYFWIDYTSPPSGAGNIYEEAMWWRTQPNSTSLSLSEGEYDWYVNCTDNESFHNTTENIWNFTITSGAVPNTAPDDPIPSLVSTSFYNYTTGDLNCSATITDTDSNVLNVTVWWYQNNISVNYTNYSDSWASGTVFNATYGSGNTSKGENWTCEMKLHDYASSSNATNSSILVIANTPPSNCSLVLPTNNSLLTNSSPNFNWTSSLDNDSDSLTYQIDIDDDIAFGSVDYTANGISDTNYTNQTNLADNTTYWWRINATDGENSSKWALFFNFTTVEYTNTLPVSNNVTLSPLEPRTTDSLNCSFNITDDSITGTITVAVNWYKDTVLSYTSNITALNDTINSTLLGIGNTTKDEVWVCGVVAYDQHDYGLEVNSSSVTILNTIPTQPILLQPTNNSLLTNASPNLNWTTSTDNDSDSITYNLDIDDNIDFSSITVSVDSIPDSNYTNNTHLTDNTTYWWRINASDGTNTSLWSIMFNFTTAEYTNTAPTVVETNITPLLPITSDSLNCSFKATDDSITGTLTANVYWYKNNISEYVSNITLLNNTINSTLLGSGNTSKDESWHCGVRVYDQQDYSAILNSTNITIQNSLPGNVTLISPANNINIDNLTPNFLWQSANDNDSDTLTYQILIDDDVAFDSPDVNISNILDTNYTNQVTLNHSQTYNWRIRANDGIGFGSWVTYWNFTTQINDPPIVAYIDLDPVIPVTTDDLNCSFTITDDSYSGILIAEVDWYRNNIWVYSKNVSALNNTLNSTLFPNSNTTKGEYWICGVTPYDNITSGTQKNITRSRYIYNSPPGNVTLIYPPNATTIFNLTSDFNWSSAIDNDSDTLTYNLQIDDSPDFGSPIYLITGIPDTNYTNQNIVLNYAITYNWRVNASDGTNTGQWVTKWIFTTLEQDKTYSQRRVTLAPGEEEVEIIPGLPGVTILMMNYIVLMLLLYLLACLYYVKIHRRRFR